MYIYIYTHIYMYILILFVRLCLMMSMTTYAVRRAVRVVRVRIYPFELFELILLLKLDAQCPAEQFERFGAAVSQSAVPCSPLTLALVMRSAIRRRANLDLDHVIVY